MHVDSTHRNNVHFLFNKAVNSTYHLSIPSTQHTQYPTCQLNYSPFFTVDQFPQTSQTQKIRELKLLSKQLQSPETLCFSTLFQLLISQPVTSIPRTQHASSDKINPLAALSLLDIRIDKDILYLALMWRDYRTHKQSVLRHR